jgi:uncharacterized protein (DUF4213/DUF364 family)
MVKGLCEGLARIIRQNDLGMQTVSVRAFPLSPEEAIGNPEERDYPLVEGRERLMQAEFLGAKGQAFTDLYGDFTGTLGEVLAMDLNSNFRRAIFVATLNAVMRHVGAISGTVHCKGAEPRTCAQKLVEYMQARYDGCRIAVTGFQPRMVEALSQRFELRVTDLDAQNIESERYGVKIWGPEKNAEHLAWCDLALVTGTTVTNGTLAQFLGDSKPAVFYGVTVAGAAQLLGLERFCPMSC